MVVKMYHKIDFGGTSHPGIQFGIGKSYFGHEISIGILQVHGRPIKHKVLYVHDCTCTKLIKAYRPNICNFLHLFDQGQNTI
jgi:hypothetical protein